MREILGDSGSGNVYAGRAAQAQTAAGQSNQGQGQAQGGRKSAFGDAGDGTPPDFTHGVSAMSPWTGTNPFNPKGFQSSVDWSQFDPGGKFGGGGTGGPDTSTDVFSGIEPFSYEGPEWSDVQWSNIETPDAYAPQDVDAALVDTPDAYEASQFGGAADFGYDAFDPQMDQFAYDQFQAPDAQAILNDPGYQFRLQQGQDALERSAAARGTLNTGGTLQGVMDYGQNLASQEYQNAYNRALGEYQMGYGQATSEHDREYARRMGEHQQGLAQAQNIAQFNEANRYRDWAANEQANQFAAQLNASNMLQAGGMNQSAQMQVQLANQAAGLQAAGMNTQAALDAARINQAGQLGAANLNQAGQFGAWDRGMQGYQTAYDYELQAAYRQQQQADAARAASAAGGRGDRNWAYQMAQDQEQREMLNYAINREEFLENRDMQFDRPMQMSDAGLQTG